jgi:putative alpha-1,2-mannosidase
VASFAAFLTIGLFPNPGQNIYFITAPLLASISLKSPLTGKTATISTTNFDPTGKKIYIQSAKLNGKAYTKSWIDHSFFTDGGKLEIVVGDTEGTWGTAKADLPPSAAVAGM